MKISKFLIALALVGGTIVSCKKTDTNEMSTNNPFANESKLAHGFPDFSAIKFFDNKTVRLQTCLFRGN